MSLIRFIISITIVASCNASGIGHIVPAVRSFPIVRYAPFYNFPTGGVRSVHAIAPAPAPVFPAPVLPAPVLPAPAVAPAPLFTSFAPRFASVPIAPPPVFGRALPLAPFAPIVRPVAHGVAPAPVYPAFAPAGFAAPAIPAPAFPAPVFPAPTLPLAAPALPAYPSAQAIALAKAFPFSVPPHARHTTFFAPPPLAAAPAPVFGGAWK